MSTTPSGTAVQDRGPVVLAVTVAFLGVSTLFVALRLVSRIGIVKRVTSDDYFIVFAWLLAFGFSVSICWGVHNGLGHHETDIPVDNQIALRKSEYAFSVLYNPVLMATKTSILLFYLTLSRNQQIFRWMTLANLFAVNAAGLALTLLNIFQCNPVGAALEEAAPTTALCIDIVTIYLSSAPVNIITDLAILFLPMPILTAMRLPRRQHIILILTFSFGAFATAVDVVRISYLQSAFEIRLQEVGKQDATTSRISEQDDFSWYASLSFMWSAIEVHTGIICACVPALKPLAARIIPSILRDTSDPNDTSQLDYGESSPPKLDSSPNIAGQLSPSSPITALPRAVQGNEEDMDMMDFLTTPETPRSTKDMQTRVKNTPSRSERPSLTYLEFYNMKEKKPMTKLSNKESIVPLALVTILFFMWGFAYGLLDVLNSQFQVVAGTTSGQGLGLHAAYYGAYFVGPLTVGRFVFLRWGFRATFITGLCIYGAGTLIFWPSGVLTSFPAFLVSNFLVGFGVSILEVAANPFVALCGPSEYAETRLNLSQGVQAVGTVVAPLLAQKVLFKNVLNAPSLIDVQWAYLGIALFDVVLAVAFYYMPIPEASDKDFEEIAQKRHSINSRKVFNVPVVYITLGLGIFSMWCYVGAQEAVAGPFENFIDAVSPKYSVIGPFNYSVVGHTVFAIGRFLCALVEVFVKPSHILVFLSIGMIVTSALAMSLVGPAGIAMIVLCQFFESGIFPLLFAISLRGLGSYTKTGSIFLTAAISGGAILPVIMYPVTNAFGLQYSFCVIVAASVFVTIYPIYLILVPAARNQVVPVHSQRRPAIPEDKRVSPYRRASHIFHTAVKRRKGNDDSCTAEHVEGAKEEWFG
ncbi:hypothetical protein MMC17_000833 [Xylographa soralifera]|nr:hypothetical protein [Xylographa soralifera]